MFVKFLMLYACGFLFSGTILKCIAMEPNRQGELPDVLDEFRTKDSRLTEGRKVALTAVCIMYYKSFIMYATTKKIALANF